MVQRLFTSLLVAKPHVVVDGATLEVGSTVTPAQAAGIRNLSALVSGGYLVPDRELSPHTPVETGATRPLAERQRTPQAYGAVLRHALLGG